MRKALYHISLMLLTVLLFVSCDRAPHGVLSKSDMADLIVDLQVAEAYIETHREEFPNDSTKQVLKQSVFKKHGITSEEYDSSLVWYAHNMEDYVKAHDMALGKLKERYDKLAKDKSKNELNRLEPGEQGGPAPSLTQGPGRKSPKLAKVGAKGDTADLWQGKRRYMLTAGMQHGFIPFDIVPDAEKQPGDRYQLAYKLTRGGNDFKVSLNIDYTDGATAQVSRGSSTDGWVTIDVQSDTTRQVRRVYGYVSYNIHRGTAAYVDSLMLMRTHLSKSNYGFINAQRLLERNQ